MGLRLALGSSRARLLRQLLIENVMLAVPAACSDSAPDAPRCPRSSVSSPMSFRGGPYSPSTRASSASPSFDAGDGRAVRLGARAARAQRRLAVRRQRDDERHDRRAARKTNVVVSSRRRVRSLGGAPRLQPAPRQSVRSRPAHRSGLSRRSRADGDDSALEGARPKAEQWFAFWNDFEQRARQLPASMPRASSLRASRRLSLGNFFKSRTRCRGQTARIPSPHAHRVGRYFHAMGIRLKEGRFLADIDIAPGVLTQDAITKGRAPVAVVVNESFVRPSGANTPAVRAGASSSTGLRG